MLGWTKCVHKHSQTYKCCTLRNCSSWQRNVQISLRAPCLSEARGPLWQLICYNCVVTFSLLQMGRIPPSTSLMTLAMMQVDHKHCAQTQTTSARATLIVTSRQTTKSSLSTAKTCVGCFQDLQCLSSQLSIAAQPATVAARSLCWML